MSTESYRFKVGTFECIAVSDGTFAYPHHSIFFVNAPKERLEQVLRKHDIRPGEITTPWTCLVIRTGQHQVLVDTGIGTGSYVPPSVGKLLRNLQAEGIGPGDIDTIILSHGHPDHIGGITDDEGKLVFPNARYVMWRDEWEFWTSQTMEAQVSEVSAEFGEIMAKVARKNLPPIRDRLDFVNHETEILPGIHAIAAPGHTLGHMALAIISDSEQLLYVSDAMLHQIHLEQPDWYAAVDFLPDLAVTTRRRLLNRAVAEKALVLAFHFPFPSLGHVIQKGETWQWQPIETVG